MIRVSGRPEAAEAAGRAGQSSGMCFALEVVPLCCLRHPRDVLRGSSLTKILELGSRRRSRIHILNHWAGAPVTAVRFDEITRSVVDRADGCQIPSRGCKR